MIRRGAFIAALAVVAMHGAGLAGKPVVGQPAPSFTMRTLKDGKLSLADLRGQVVVLNYWATWCVPCREELPLLDGYYRAAAEHGLRVFAITTEDSVPLNRMRKLTDHLAISVVRSLHGDYGVMTGVPTNYIIDRAGVLRYAKAGALKLDDLNRIIVPLLNEPAPAP